MFESLEEYYNYIENDSKMLFDFNISNSLLKVRDTIESQELKQQCSYEIYFADYSLNNGMLTPKITYINGESYPNFKLFDDDFNYIKKQAENISNPKYKAKYNQLLWESPFKHRDYAVKAIDNYLLFLENATFLISDNLSNHSFESCFKNLFIEVSR